MVIYNIHDFFSGMKIILHQEPYVIIRHTLVTPGKGQSFSRVCLRNIISGKIIEKIFKSGDIAESADILNVTVIYLYNDNKWWYFMNNTNFEQLVTDKKVIANNYKWLVSQDTYTITLWNNHPISIIPPNFVILKVVKTNLLCKDDTIHDHGKIATLSTGVTTKVPWFIQIGEFIKIDTRSNTYISRIK